MCSIKKTRLLRIKFGDLFDQCLLNVAQKGDTESSALFITSSLHHAAPALRDT